MDTLIETVSKENESTEEFAKRIENEFLELYRSLNNPKIISLLGIGDGGHTAGIFPMNEAQFNETYLGDRIYVPVHLDGLTIDSRASFT